MPDKIDGHLIIRFVEAGRVMRRAGEIIHSDASERARYDDAMELCNLAAQLIGVDVVKFRSRERQRVTEEAVAAISSHLGKDYSWLIDVLFKGPEEYARQHPEATGEQQTILSFGRSIDQLTGDIYLKSQDTKPIYLPTDMK